MSEEPRYTRATFEKTIAENREWLASITDQQLAEMKPHEREFVFKLRAGQHAFDRGDSAELERLVQVQLEELQRVLR